MDRVSHLGDTWQETLLKQIDDRGYTDTEVYKRANVDRKLFINKERRFANEECLLTNSAGAALDVFRTEPLPENSRLWNTKDRKRGY